MGLLLTTVGCRGGCRGPGGRTATPAGLLSMFPPETRIVLSIDFRRIRTTAVWQQLSALAADDPEDRRIIAELTARTGLDPWKQIHRLIAVFPDDARADGAFAVLFEGEGFDDKRLVTYARDRAKLRGGSIEQRLHGKQTLWIEQGEAGRPPVAGFFLDRQRFVLGGGGWAEKVADLVDGRQTASAADNGTLVRLAERVGQGASAPRAVWLAAIVPESTRQRLMADPRFGVQASVMRLGAAADLTPGLAAELVAELSNQDDARALVARMTGFVTAAKRSPQALLLGAGPYLDGVRAEADGPTVRVRLALGEAQTAELVQRLKALARAPADGRPQ